MCSFKSIYFVIFILNLYKTNAQISDKRLCVDPDCKEPVSLAKTLLRYSSPDARILSFAPNEDITIYSKEAGSETGLWGAEIRGKRGYVPKRLVRESKVINVPKLLVDTELKQKPQVPIDASKANVKPNKVQESFEVVDGTTIYISPQDEINPSSTESPILSTVAPEVSEEGKDNAVESSKEKDAVEKESKEESVVENVISTFSHWMTDNTDSEEHEDIEDDEDDEEDEEEDEEESAEDSTDSLEKIQDQVNKTSSEKAEDMNILNSLHNLPPGVTVSPYSLEVDQPLKENIKNESVASTQDTTLQQKPPVGSSPIPASLESNKQNPTIPENKVNSISDSISEVKEQIVEEKPPSNLDLQPEKKEEIVEVKKEVDEKLISGPVKLETVTEPTFGEDESLPILDEVTPNPLDTKIEGGSKISDTPVEENHLVSTDTPQQNLIADTSKNQQLDLDQSANPQSKAVDPPNVEVKLNSDQQTLEQAGVNAVEDKMSQSDHNQNPVQKEENKISTKIPLQPPLVGLFNKTQNLVPSKQLDKEETPVVQSVNEDSKKEESASNEVLKQDIKSEETTVSDVSKEENTVQENGTPIIENDFPKDSGNEGKTSKEETDADSEEKVVSDIKDDVANEVSNEENASKDDNVDLANVSLEEIENTASNSIPEINQQTMEEKPPTEDLNHPEKEEEEISNYDITEDDKVTSKEDIIEEVLKDKAENLEVSVEKESSTVGDSGGFLSGLFSFFGSDTTGESAPNPPADTPLTTGESISGETENTLSNNVWSSQHNQESANADLDHCYGNMEDCKTSQQEVFKEKGLLENLELNFNSDVFLYLITTAISVILFLFGYMALDRNKREAPLIAKINKLEKQLLITLKENELLQENGASMFVQEIDSAPNEVVERLTQRLGEVQLAKQAFETRVLELEKELGEKEGLEEQIENLEKELETSTEVGMELNRIISEMLDPTNGSERLRENVEQLQRQLLEQKDTINTINESLRKEEAENNTLRVELAMNKKLVIGLQNKLDKVVGDFMKAEEEKDQQQKTLQNEIAVYQQKYSEAASREDILNSEIQVLRTQLSEVEKKAEIKTSEYQMLKESLSKIKSLKNDSSSVKLLLDATSSRAELKQLKAEIDKYMKQLQQEQSLKAAYERKYKVIVEETKVLKEKYEQADKEKVEVNSKLEVLNSYFKKREAELQEEVIKYKSIWDAKEGEATSTTERIKYMQEEIENYKAQNETLKQEIMSQEIELKSQISMLEKKVHENWVAARQADRKLEDARQEAAQLRNRLTLRERAIHEERAHNRLQSPLEQNGELPLSPHPIDSPASPPLLYGRDHITKSPPLPGMPPFLPPPPGAPFMPPPMHGMPPFMPPPPSMYPADHRPPPLGRMSSPPLNSRYSPDDSAFSPYDRNSPSPPYDSEYGVSPPPIRGYSPYNSRDDRRDYKRPPHARTNGRNTKGSRMSSGSDHSNDSLDKINRKQSKMV